jgi:hypothetical protein
MTDKKIILLSACSLLRNTCCCKFSFCVPFISKVGIKYNIKRSNFGKSMIVIGEPRLDRICNRGQCARTWQRPAVQFACMAPVHCKADRVALENHDFLSCPRYMGAYCSECDLCYRNKSISLKKNWSGWLNKKAEKHNFQQTNKSSCTNRTGRAGNLKKKVIS